MALLPPPAKLRVPAITCALAPPRASVLLTPNPLPVTVTDPGMSSAGPVGPVDATSPPEATFNGWNDTVPVARLPSSLPVFCKTWIYPVVVLLVKSKLLNVAGWFSVVNNATLPSIFMSVELPPLNIRTPPATVA